MFGVSATTVFAGIGAAAAVYGATQAGAGGDAQAAALTAGQATQAQSLANQLALQKQALTQQQTQYTQNVAMEQPYMNAGQGALSEYDQLLGIQPTAPSYNTDAFNTATNAYQTSINAAPLTAAQFKKLSPQDQQNYMSDGNGGQIVNPKMINQPVLSDFSSAAGTPYDTGAYNAAMQQWQLNPTGPMPTMQSFSNTGAGAGQGALSPSLQQGTVPAPTAVGGTPPAASGTAPAAGAGGPTSASIAAAQMGALSSTPGYQFELEQGEQAIRNSASATTGVLSTAENQAATRYAEGLAGTTYNSFMDRLNGVNTEGQQAASQTVAAGQANANAQGAIAAGSVNATANTGNNISQLQAGVGAAQASGMNGAAGALSSGINSIGSNLMMSQLMNNGGGGGGGSLSAAELAVQPPG